MSKPQKPFRFWFHYNKPTSKKMEMPVWTVHWRGTCYQVLRIQCNVDTETHGRNSQPHAVVRGFAHHVELRLPLEDRLPYANDIFRIAYIEKVERAVDWKYHTSVQSGSGFVGRHKVGEVEMWKRVKKKGKEKE